ncbi:MAG: hypothetical protein PVS3B3_06410 [Ktedonobacteraceae bacterium]
MDNRELLVLPQQTLLVLCGVAGAGKSTFARRLIEEQYVQGLRATSIVSSDYCRELVCDDENNQRVSRDAFDVLYYIVQKRLLLGRFTIVDSTALQAGTRHRLLEIAQYHHYNTCLLIFNTSPTTCIQRDRTRTRRVGEEVIHYHHGLLHQVVLDAPLEGWQQVRILEEQKQSEYRILIDKA